MEFVAQGAFGWKDGCRYAQKGGAFITGGGSESVSDVWVIGDQVGECP